MIPANIVKKSRIAHYVQPCLFCGSFFCRSFFVGRLSAAGGFLYHIVQGFAICVHKKCQKCTDSARSKHFACIILYKVLLYVYTKNAKNAPIRQDRSNLLVPYCTRFCSMCTQKHPNMHHSGKIELICLYHSAHGFAVCVHKKAGICPPPRCSFRIRMLS